jgi:hypothetical protein
VLLWPAGTAELLTTLCCCNSMYNVLQVLGLGSLTMMSTAAIIGSGIFVLTGAWHRSSCVSTLYNTSRAALLLQSLLSASGFRHLQLVRAASLASCACQTSMPPWAVLQALGLHCIQKQSQHLHVARTSPACQACIRQHDAQNAH